MLAERGSEWRDGVIFVDIGHGETTNIDFHNTLIRPAGRLCRLV